MLYYIVSLLPIFAYLFVLVYCDIFSIVKKEKIIISFIWGAVVCVFLFYLVNYLIDIEKISFFVPLLEEIFKFALIIYFFKKGEVLFLSDSIIYGASVGAGFAFVENLIYTSLIDNWAFSTFIYRGFATSLLHFITTGFATALLVILSRWKPKAHLNVLYVVFALTPSILLHFLHNQFFVNPMVSFIIILCGTVLSFALIMWYNTKMVNMWLDKSLDSHIAVVSSLNEGNFQITREGKYLLSLKDKYKEPFFTDIFEYVKVFFSLSVVAKTVMIYREYDVPDKEIRGLNADNIKEFHRLRNNIGNTVLKDLEAIVDSRSVDVIINILK